MDERRNEEKGILGEGVEQREQSRHSRADKIDLSCSVRWPILTNDKLHEVNSHLSQFKSRYLIVREPH